MNSFVQVKWRLTNFRQHSSILSKGWKCEIVIVWCYWDEIWCKWCTFDKKKHGVSLNIMANHIKKKMGKGENQINAYWFEMNLFILFNCSWVSNDLD